MKNIFILLMVLSISLFSQNKEQALHIMFAGTDSTFFDDEGLRWNEFSLTPRKMYKVMDLMESDTTSKCIVFKGNKPYMNFLKEEGNEPKMNKFNRSVIGYLECYIDGYFINMWIFKNESFGYIVTGQS